MNSKTIIASSSTQKQMLKMENRNEPESGAPNYGGARKATVWRVANGRR
jgi:hypothetical protein